MSSQTVALLVFKSSTLVLAAFAFGWCLRRSQATLRGIVWNGTFAALLLLPLLAWWRPLSVSIPSAVLLIDAGTPETGRHTTNVSNMQPAIRRVDSHADIPGRTSFSASAAVWSADLRVVAQIVYGIGVTLLLFRIVLGWIAVRRLVRGTEAITSPEWQVLLAEIATHAGLKRLPRLVTSDAVTVPFACGLMRTVIALPPAASEWSTPCRRAVLLHEVSHIKRRDLVLHALALAVRAIYWFHPLVWMAEARRRTDSERACDEYVMAAGFTAGRYADILLDVFTSARASFAFPETAALRFVSARRSELETRLHDILTSSRKPRAAGMRTRATISVTLVLYGFLTIAVAPTRASGNSRHAGRANSRIAVSSVDATHPARIPGPATPSVTSVLVPHNLALDLVAAEAAERRDARPDVGIPDNQPPVSIPGLNADGLLASIGRWTMRLAGAADGVAREKGDSVAVLHVALYAPGLNTFYAPLIAMEGVRATAAGMQDGPQTFLLKRDAGSFRFDGTFEQGRGAGQFSFEPNARFAAEIQQRKIGTLSADDLLTLARHDVGLAFLDELAAQGYETPDAVTLVRASRSGADLAYLRQMGTSGRRVSTLEELVNLANRGVKAELNSLP